jgi:hypothetical protein
LYHGGDAAAEVMRVLEQLVPKGAGAEAGDDGEIDADLYEGAAEGATTHLALKSSGSFDRVWNHLGVDTRPSSVSEQRGDPSPARSTKRSP